MTKRTIFFKVDVRHDDEDGDLLYSDSINRLLTEHLEFSKAKAPQLPGAGRVVLKSGFVRWGETLEEIYCIGSKFYDFSLYDSTGLKPEAFDGGAV